MFETLLLFAVVPLVSAIYVLLIKTDFGMRCVMGGVIVRHDALPVFLFQNGSEVEKKQDFFVI